MKVATGLKPYKQGNLDNLCGIYAIINALRWGLRHSAPISESDCMALKLAMIQSLEKRGQLIATIEDGLSIPEFTKLLKTAEIWLQKKKGISQLTHKPFHTKRSLPLETFSMKLSEHLSNQKSAAVFVTTGRLEHWTVPTDINSKIIKLWDSDGLQWFRLQNCSCTTFDEPSLQTLKIIPSGLFLLSFSIANSNTLPSVRWE